MSAATVANNKDAFVSSANTSYPSYRPMLSITYTPQSNDYIPHLRWPLGTINTGRNIGGGYDYNVPWNVPGTACPDGTWKQHVGRDYQAAAGTSVYAAEDGYMKQNQDQRPSGWAYNLVIEHTSPTGAKYTTVYWHINPSSDVISNWNGGFIAKGAFIGNVASIPTGAHLHFGKRNTPYNVVASGVGALPKTSTPCYTPSGALLPQFPSNFVNPENSSEIIFN